MLSPKFILLQIEDRYRELSADVTKKTTDKRKTLQNRKNNLGNFIVMSFTSLA